MSAIDFLLNIAAVLLWLSYRARRFDPLATATPATIVGTLRRAEPLRLRGWHLLVLIAVLVASRSILYWQIGPAVNWVPVLSLGGIAVSFRSDLLLHTLIFSALSFLTAIIIFYACLLLLDVVNQHSPEPDPVQ